MINRLNVMVGLLITAILSVEMRCLSDLVLRAGVEEAREQREGQDKC